MLFDENYGLASTQSLKNKDIPEGGAKGTILPSYVLPIYRCERLADLKGRLGENPKLCFEKYVDVSTSCDVEMWNHKLTWTIRRP